MRALDAPKARILHNAAPEPTRWPPGFGPHGSTSPRTPRLAASRQTTLARYSATARAFLAALRRPQRLQPRAALPKLLPLATWPLEQRELIRSHVH